MTKPTEPTDTQLVLLSAASQREDNLLSPARLRGGAAVRVAGSLLAADLVEELVVLNDDLHWRDDPGQGRIGLRLTPAGFAAIGVIDPPEAGLKAEAVGSVRNDLEASPQDVSPNPLVYRRTGSKRALVLCLLQREEGAALDDLVQATGWLPHTARAALTGLRHDGVMIERTKTPGGRSLYRVAVPVGAEV